VRRLEAEIILDYEDARIAESVARAVSPDNFKTPKNLKIKTAFEKGRVVTHIEFEGRLETFVATIDDLLSCTSTAEKTIHTAKKLE
jgi:tRNA threonylcarbamoyladenosine modification (KEOPS) complex  Pcc1 subunit